MTLEKLVDNAMRLFYEIREVKGLKKKPSTSELIDWLKLLLMEKIKAGELEGIDLYHSMPPHASALLKNEQDLDLMSELQKIKGRGQWNR